MNQAFFMAINPIPVSLWNLLRRSKESAGRSIVFKNRGIIRSAGNLLQIPVGKFPDLFFLRIHLIGLFLHLFGFPGVLLFQG